MKFRIVVLAFSCLIPVIAMCDDAPPPPPPQNVWTGKGQAGYTSSQGNTDAKSANAALDASYLDGAFQHLFHLGGLYGQSGNVVSAERWDTAWQTNYDFTKSAYTFGGLRYERDKFSGFQYQASGTLGVGYKFFDTDTLKLSAQIGVGYRELRPEDLIYSATGNGQVIARILEPSQGNAVGTAGVTYSQVLTKTTTLSDKLLVESGADDTTVHNTLALAVKISTKLALSVGYNIQHNTNPPGILKKTDTLETLNLVYAF